MKLRTFARTVSVLAVTVGSLHAVGGLSDAAETTNLTILNNYQYSANNIMDGTVCLDGEVVASGEFELSAPIETTPGTHQLTVFVGQVTSDCDAEDGITQQVDLLDADAQTLAYGYPEEGEGLAIWQFDDDIDCTPAGEGWVTFRHLGYTWDADPAEFGFDDAGTFQPFLGSVGFGDEFGTLLPAGTYPSVSGGAGEQDFVSLFDDLVVAEHTYQVVYSFAGADGAVGIIGSEAVAVASCEEPTTTTEAPATTTTTVADEAPAEVPAAPAPTAPPAAAVAGRPAYTG